MLWLLSSLATGFICLLQFEPLEVVVQSKEHTHTHPISSLFSFYFFKKIIIVCCHTRQNIILMRFKARSTWIIQSVFEFTFIILGTFVPAITLRLLKIKPTHSTRLILFAAKSYSEIGNES